MKDNHIIVMFVMLFMILVCTIANHFILKKLIIVSTFGQRMDSGISWHKIKLIEYILNTDEKEIDNMIKENGLDK